jgi:hypothetical protein
MDFAQKVKDFSVRSKHARITMRDARPYCCIFMDDNNRKPICCLYYNAKKIKSVSIFGPDNTETKHLIDDLSDIFKHADAIEATEKAYA